MRLLTSEQFYAQPEVSSTDALSADSYSQVAELSASLSQGYPNGDQELGAKEPTEPLN